MKKKLKKFTPFLVLFFLTALVFRVWFTFKPISATDWIFLHPGTTHSFSLIPPSWFSLRNFGANSLSTFWIATYYHLTVFVATQVFKIPWFLAEKIFWFWPFLVLAIFSSWYLAKTLFPKGRIIKFLAPLIYLFNTYILMVIGGGQMGIAMAYALAPLVFAIFAKRAIEDKPKLKVLSGLVLALQVVFGPRIVLVTMTAVFLYAVFQYGLAVKKYLKLFVLPFLITLGIHFYWLLPIILFRKTGLPSGFSEPGWVEFLSFADFSNTLSLLHPNWPENIFGKTYFMRSEFILIPLVAFSSLLFLKRKKISADLKRISTDKRILFFAFLALIGAFLAKGSKPPFGGVYLWLFDNFPGFNLFRDSTKFYLLVALSFSILIPFSLEQISQRLKRLTTIKHLVFVFFILFWLFLIRPAWLNQLGGTFKTKEVPSEYLVLKNFLHNQKDFFRTLWIPKRQRFGFFSQSHSTLESLELLPKEELAIKGVKYVIIPFDSEGEIFLEDRKYDHQQRLALEEELDKVDWLRKLDVADKIAIYETPSYQDRFSIVDEERVFLDWEMIDSTKYKVSLKTEKPVTLVFSEAYDELWQARIGEKKISSKEDRGLNNFPINQAGDFEILVEYLPQKYVYWGMLVSALTLSTTIGVLIFLRVFYNI